MRSAAFFDLDRTLMAGSSGLPWARAATKAGLVSRRQMARWGVDALRFRLRGSTDEATERLLEEIKEVFRGTSAREIARLAPEVLVGVLPRIYPEMLEEVYAHQDAGRPTFIVSAAGDELVQLLARILYMDGGIGTAYEVGEDGLFTGELGGAFMYGEGKVEAMRRFAAEHEIDLAGVLRLLGLRLGPADAASGRQPGRRQPRRGAGAGRPRAGLAGDALREARAPPRDRRLHASCSRSRGFCGRHRIGPWTGPTSRSRASRARRS